MVAPVNNSGGIVSLQRTTQSPVTNSTSNKPASTPVTRAATVAKSPSTDTTITLASGKAPPTNLPRGSIVDKLV